MICLIFKRIFQVDEIVAERWRWLPARPPKTNEQSSWHVGKFPIKSPLVELNLNLNFDWTWNENKFGCKIDNNPINDFESVENAGQGGRKLRAELAGNVSPCFEGGKLKWIFHQKIFKKMNTKTVIDTHMHAGPCAQWMNGKFIFGGRHFDERLASSGAKWPDPFIELWRFMMPNGLIHQSAGIFPPFAKSGWPQRATWNQISIRRNELVRWRALEHTAGQGTLQIKSFASD